MPEIGPETRQEVADQVKALLNDYSLDVNEAYLTAGEDPLAIAFAVKISPDVNGNRVETGINFITGRIKDKISGRVDEEQMKLFPPEEKGWNPRFPLTIYPPPRVGIPRSRFNQLRRPRA